jgi:hypothetical protein
MNLASDAKITQTVPAALQAVAQMTPLQAQQILNKHADAIRAYARRTVHDIIEIGRLLVEAKKMVGPGNFLSWIEREFAWSEDTAERFIAVYALQRQIPHVAELSLPFSGLYLLAAPSTPKQAVEEVVAKAEAGERMSVVEIKSTIAEAKAKVSAHVQKPKLPSYSPAEKHNVPNTEGANKSAKAVTPEDTALFAFTERVLDLIRRVGNHVPDRFARKAVKAHDLAKLGKFFTDLAELLKADGASQPVSSLEDEVVF